MPKANASGQSKPVDGKRSNSLFFDERIYRLGSILEIHTSRFQRGVFLYKKLVLFLYMNKHKLRSLVVVVGLYVALGLMIFMTNPSKLPIILLIVPFLLMFSAVFLTVRLLLQKFFPRLDRAKQMFISGCIAGLPSFLLILSSINQLTWRDAFLVILLVIFLLFYASRINFFRNTN